MKKYLPILIVTVLFIFAACGDGIDDKVIYYSVSFDSNGGNPTPAVQKIEEGAKATAPTVNPSKEGYVFMFWHVKDATTAYDFKSPVKKDFTLYAKWNEDSWQVTWELDGGAWPENDNHVANVEKGGSLPEPEAPIKSDYIFDGWYNDADLTNKITFPYDVSDVTADFTLYAKWNEKYWQVEWELDGGAWPENDNHATKIEKEGSLAEPEAPIKSDYIFDGWYSDADLTNKVTFPYDVSSVTANFTLYAKWNEKYWQVEWELDGGTWPENDNHATRVEKEGSLAEPTSPEKTGYVLEGWYNDVDLTNEITFPYNVSDVTADFTLYAKWVVETFPLKTNMVKAKYFLKYTIEVDQAKKSGQSIHTITDNKGNNVYVRYNPNGTLNYMSSSTYFGISTFNRNIPILVSNLSSSDVDLSFVGASQIRRGDYDYTNDPSEALVFFGDFYGSSKFSSLDNLKLISNNNNITRELYDRIFFPTNCYKVIIFGKNETGELIGKYVGYSLRGDTFSYWCIDPDDPFFENSTTVSLP